MLLRCSLPGRSRPSNKKLDRCQTLGIEKSVLERRAESQFGRNCLFVGKVPGTNDKASVAVSERRLAARKRDAAADLRKAGGASCAHFTAPVAK